jgi:hypothetical protein
MKIKANFKIILTLFISVFCLTQNSFSEEREVLKGCINKDSGRFSVSKRCTRDEVQFSERSFSTALNELKTSSEDANSKFSTLDSQIDQNTQKINENRSEIDKNTNGVSSVNENISTINDNIYNNAENVSNNANNIRNNALNISTVSTAIFENANTIVGNTTSLLVLSEQLKAIPSPNTVIHVANGDGDFSSIRKAVEAAKTTLPSNFHRILIKVAPGLYFETETIELDEYISIEGSGVGVTELSSAAGLAIKLAKNSSLKNLTISHTSESSLPSVLVDSILDNLLVENLKINTTVVNGEATALDITQSNASLKNIEINISGENSTSANGIIMTGEGSSIVKDLKINIQNLAASAIVVSDGYQLNLKNSMISLTTENSANLTGISISGEDSVFNSSDLDLMINGLENLNAILISETKNVEIKNLKLNVLGTTTSGIHVENNGELKIHNSLITTESDQATLGVFNSSKIYIGNSQLSGGDTREVSGEITCVGVYDEDYIFSSDTCP